MLWLTWRQFRAQAIVASAALVAVAIALAVTGPHLASLFDSNGLPTCRVGCGVDASNFINQVKGSGTELVFYGGILLMYAVPALIGLFWGAPLVTRELESGTFRLAWNQSVTRTRWIAVKLGLIGLAAMATAGLLSLMISLWSGPLYQAAQKAGGSDELSISRFAPPLFGANGVAPIGYAAFAFVLGVTVGVLLRRLVPAMAITLALFAAVQLLMISAVRPHLIPASSAIEPLSAVTFNGEGETDNGHLLLDLGTINRMPGAWIVNARPVNSAGQLAATVPQPCASMTNTWLQCLASHGVRIQVSYQPTSRYWAFQWLETGTFVTLAAGLGALCYSRVRRLT